MNHKKSSLSVIAIMAAIFCCASKISAQIPGIEWQKCLGGSSVDEALAIRQTADNGYIVAGYTDSDDSEVTGLHAPSDFWVVKLDTVGNIQWEKALGGSNAEVAEDIMQTFDGGYIVTGYTNSNDGAGEVSGNHGTWDYWVVKLSAAGDIIWQRSLGGSFQDLGYSIKQTTDSGYIVAGSSFSDDGNVSGNHDSADAWVVKLSPTGGVQWEKSLGGSRNEDARSIKQTSDGGYIVTGTTNSNDGDFTSNHGGYDAWVMKLSDTGAIQWQRTYGDTGTDIAQAIQQTFDSGYIVAGYSNSTAGDVTGNHGGFDYWILKISSLGDIQWENTYGGSNDDIAAAIQQTTDSGYIVAGTTFSDDSEITANYGQSDAWIIKLSSSGGLLWQKSFGGSDYDGARSIQQTSDSGFILAGYTLSVDSGITDNHGGADFWVVKLGFNVQVDTTTAVVAIKPVSNTISIYPNPATQNVTITASAKINDVIITNLFGQTVHAQKNNSQQVDIDVAALPAGVYFMKINDGEVRKLVKE